MSKNMEYLYTEPTPSIFDSMTTAFEPSSLTGPGYMSVDIGLKIPLQLQLKSAQDIEKYVVDLYLKKTFGFSTDQIKKVVPELLLI